jgi:hypothetical protein
MGMTTPSNIAQNKTNPCSMLSHAERQSQNQKQEHLAKINMHALKNLTVIKIEFSEERSLYERGWLRHSLRDLITEVKQWSPYAPV